MVSTYWNQIATETHDWFDRPWSHRYGSVCAQFDGRDIAVFFEYKWYRWAYPGYNQTFENMLYNY